MKNIFTFFLLVFAFSVFGEEPETVLKSANQAYADKNYEAALLDYTQLVDSGYKSVALFYNLGNTHYRLGHLGQTILFYEKALKLAPEDADIQQNLKWVEAQKIDVFETVPVHFFSKIWTGFLKTLSTTMWSVLAFCCLFLSSFILVILLRLKRKSTALFAGYLFTAIAGLAALYLAYQRNYLDHNNNYGIVVVDNTYVKSEPSTGQDLFMVHEGSKALIEENFKSWTKVRWPDGKSGWIESTTLEKI